MSCAVTYLGCKIKLVNWGCNWKILYGFLHNGEGKILIVDHNYFQFLALRDTSFFGVAFISCFAFFLNDFHAKGDCLQSMQRRALD